MRYWLGILFVLLHGPAFADPIGIRSGAHQGFARLVLDVPTLVDWRLEPRARGARLFLNNYNDGFETSAIFDRIDRSYISSVEADDSGINIIFNCDCEATVFSQGNRMIVVDVANAPEKAIDGVGPNEDFAFVGQNSLRFDGLSPRARAGSEGMKQKSSVIQAVPPPSPLLGITETGNLPVSSENLTTTPVLDQLHVARKKLTKEIGVAATRGILARAESDLETILSAISPHIDTRIFDSSLPRQQPLVGPSPTSGNIRISSSADTLRTSQQAMPVSTSLGVPCINPADLAVQNWGSQKGLTNRLSDLRGHLFGEFDRMDRAMAVELVQTYLHYGFGAEAKQILLMDETLARAHPALISIAEVMEFGHSPNSTFLQHFLDCDSDVALWSILSVKDISPSETINAQAALLSLSSLPMHLRSFIAPELSRRLLAYGDEDAAAAALRSLERAPGTLSPDANLAKANLEMAQGMTIQAQNRLSDVVASNAEQSAEALIQFVDSHLEEDAQIDEGVATLVEAYALEMRDSIIGDELRRTHVLALGKSGQFSEAFEALSRVRARNANIRQDTLRSSILDLLTRNASEAEFLDHAFTQMTIAPETLSSRTRQKIASRLHDLGFHGQAEELLDAGPQDTNPSRTTLLRAKLSLALDRPQEALTLLFSETSSEASLLRAKAKMQVGDYAEAHSIYEEIGDEVNSSRTAWMADDWVVLVEEASPVFGPVASVAQTSLDAPADLEGMLERTTSAISESKEARGIITELLKFGNIALRE